MEKNIEIAKQINRIQKELADSGIVVETLVEELKKLREFFIQEKMPRMVKILRLAYEHLEEYETFDIAIPEDEDSETDEELSAEELKIESLSYLVSLFERPENKINAEDLNYYMHAFTEYAETH